ncbi:resolvase-like protein, partial [Mesorhizobium alhagi CCNWXJ12-2]
MTETRCALYARVSSEAQTRDNTIASQVTALHERIAADGFVLEPGHSYQDDGYSGSILLRPALERLRDAVASGLVERLYVHAPDRLARRYAHQALLMDEFRRSGVEIVFLNRPIGGTAEDDLLLQVQGVIAEYERAKILERSRRGRRHAARSGSVSALTGAPFGYRYVSREQGGGVARFEVVEAEAHIVRLIFAWVGLDRMSLRQVCRQLEQIGCQTRTGATHWHASTIRGMLANPAYVGHAAFGRARYLPPRPRLRPIRGHPQPSPRATCRVAVPSEEWIEIPVAPLVDPTVFEAARAQLEENRKRKRQRMPGSAWLLQGLTVCRRCGYAYYGKRAPRSRKYDPANTLRYYRCIGADGYRFSGRSVCDNSAVRGDHLEEAVWDQVKGLLEDPRRVADEYRRRLVQVRDETREPDEIARLERQMASLRRGIGRLIDSYAEGVIDKAEFEPRIAGLKQRLSQLQERHQAAVEVAENERELSLLISRLEDFSAKVTAGLAGLDRTGMQQIIRTVVRRVEIDDAHIEIIFRVPPLDGPAGPKSPSEMTISRQHCTAVDDPAARQSLEAFGFVRPLDDLQGERADLLHRALELRPGIAAVGEDVSQ